MHARRNSRIAISTRGSDAEKNPWLRTLELSQRTCLTNFQIKRLKLNLDIVEKPENRVHKLTDSNVSLVNMFFGIVPIFVAKDIARRSASLPRADMREFLRACTFWRVSARAARWSNLQQNSWLRTLEHAYQFSALYYTVKTEASYIVEKPENWVHKLTDSN